MELRTWVKIVEAAGFEVQGYSGRNMYRKYCLGVRCQDPISTTARIVAQFVRDNNNTTATILNEILEAFENSATDSLGRGSILYFPSIEWKCMD